MSSTQITVIRTDALNPHLRPMRGFTPEPRDAVYISRTQMDLQRPPKSADPPLGTTECEVHVRAKGPTLTAETLVYLLRESADVANTAFFSMCGGFLVGHRQGDGSWTGGRSEKIIMSVGTWCGVNSDEGRMNEFRGECHSELWKAILDGRDAKPYWEERFGRALKDKCIDVARKVFGQARRDKKLKTKAMGEALAMQQDAVPLDEEVFERLEPRTDHVPLILAAIRRLPKRQAQAAFLRWVERRPIDSGDHRSVRKVLGITARAVHHLLKKARTALSSDPIVRKVLGGEL